MSNIYSCYALVLDGELVYYVDTSPVIDKVNLRVTVRKEKENNNADNEHDANKNHHRI